ncbi:MAG TPA: hypothetical protein VMJ52_15875 [Xanthobacteraceae bacterium]|nr:hypothetical protein [Xanthobacteraceae bacterium]
MIGIERERAFETDKRVLIPLQLVKDAAARGQYSNVIRTRCDGAIVVCQCLACFAEARVRDRKKTECIEQIRLYDYDLPADALDFGKPASLECCYGATECFRRRGSVVGHTPARNQLVCISRPARRAQFSQARLSV